MIEFMALASNERRERNKQNERLKRNTNNTNGVVITVYRESVRTRSRRKGSEEKTKPRGSGHDRRALLLAHSGELRNAWSQKVDDPLPRTKSKLVGTRLTQPVRFSWRFSLTKMCRNEGVESKQRNPNAFSFLSKMNNAFKKLSCKEM